MEWLTVVAPVLDALAREPSVGALLSAAGAGMALEARLPVAARILRVAARVIPYVLSSSNPLPVPPSPPRSAPARRTRRKAASSEAELPLPANDNKVPF